ncbi:hypothetical protein BCON_0049g00030 [Botryotinia convoluta]|uniref:Myb-like domain-containing protein n=1 Tax=Botryotinia convoluta TaxID=54673 RepID=A0A4Z1IID4_9HELO|nr:hypothetical protein BCON_0049g00030 [Botryotinia convoluta]
MEQHSGTNSFGKRDNNDPPRREEYRLRPRREMWADHQDSRRDSDSYASRYDRNQPRREVDRYRPGYRRENPYFPRVPHRNHAARYPSRLGPGTRETTTQGSQPSRFDTARTSLSSAAGSADTSQEFESAPMVSHPVEAAPSPEKEEAPPSRAEDEYELLSEYHGGSLRRFTKRMCDVITETITENSGDDYMSPIEILNRACKNVALKTGTILEVHDCWLYWRKKVMQSNIAQPWPDSLDDVDKEVAEYRQLKNTKSDSARAAYAARLATTAVTCGSSATAGTTETVAASEPAKNPKYWPQEEKNFLFEMIKKRRNGQYRVKTKGFWTIVGAAMRREGYTRKSEEYREWFEKHGRRYFNYDETVYYSRPGDRRVGAGRMQHGVMTPEDSPVGDARRRRRGDPQLNGGRVRSRGSLAQRSPRTPRTPKPVKPRMSSVVLHDVNSLANGYRIVDKTAKAAENFPLQLITPSTGERFEPFTTEAREVYDPSPSSAASPPGNPLFIIEDEPQTERSLDPSARNSTISRLSSTPPLTDSQSMMPEERVGSIGKIEPVETMTPDGKIGSTEAMPENENNASSLQPNETDDTKDDIQWIGDEWGFATPPTMRPSGTDDMAQIDNQIDFNSSHISASTDSSDPSTFATPPSFDDSLTSNETTEEIPLSQPVFTSNVDSENNNSSESEAQLLREQQERTDLEISNLRANYLIAKEAGDDDRKKLDDTAQELDILIVRRAEQLESQTANLAEMQRIEAELQEKEKVKQVLSVALEVLGFNG